MFPHHMRSCALACPAPHPLQFTFLLDDIGVPLNYRHMEGFGVHTFMLLNKDGKETLVKFHWKPTCGEWGRAHMYGVQRRGRSRRALVKTENAETGSVLWQILVTFCCGGQQQMVSASASARASTSAQEGSLQC